jgi:hypothetical protein
MHPGPSMIDPSAIPASANSNGADQAKLTRVRYGKTVIVAKSPGAAPDDKAPKYIANTSTIAKAT